MHSRESRGRQGIPICLNCCQKGHQRMNVSSSTPPPTPTRSTAQRFWYGLGLGMVPAILTCLFGFTQCPPGINDGLICNTVNEPYQGIGGWLFVFAVGIYGLNALLLLVLLFVHTWRPFAWGLLLMFVLAPILGVLGFAVIAIARYPR